MTNCAITTKVEAVRQRYPDFAFEAVGDMLTGRWTFEGQKHTMTVNLRDHVAGSGFDATDAEARADAEECIAHAVLRRDQRRRERDSG